MRINVVTEPERLTPSEMKTDLAELKKKLARAEKAAADPKPDTAMLATERERARAQLVDLQNRAAHLKHVTGILERLAGENPRDREVSDALAAHRREHAAIVRQVEDAADAERRAIKAWREASELHAARSRRVRELVALIYSREHAIAKEERRLAAERAKPRSWRDLIVVKD